MVLTSRMNCTNNKQIQNWHWPLQHGSEPRPGSSETFSGSSQSAPWYGQEISVCEGVWLWSGDMHKKKTGLKDSFCCGSPFFQKIAQLFPIAFRSFLGKWWPSWVLPLSSMVRSLRDPVHRTYNMGDFCQWSIHSLGSLGCIQDTKGMIEIRQNILEATHKKTIQSHLVAFIQHIFWSLMVILSQGLTSLTLMVERFDRQ